MGNRMSRFSPCHCWNDRALGCHCRRTQRKRFIISRTLLGVTIRARSRSGVDWKKSIRPKAFNYFRCQSAVRGRRGIVVLRSIRQWYEDNHITCGSLGSSHCVVRSLVDQLLLPIPLLHLFKDPAVDSTANDRRRELVLRNYSKVSEHWKQVKLAGDV